MSGADASALLMIGRVPSTGKMLTGGGSAAPAGSASWISSSCATRSGGPRLSPYFAGVPSPFGSGAVRTRHSGSARARL